MGNDKKSSLRSYRAVILLIIPVCFVVYCNKTTQTSFDVEMLLNAKDNQIAWNEYNKTRDKFDKSAKDMSESLNKIHGLLKLPIGLLGYNLYVENKFSAFLAEDSRSIYSIFRVDFFPDEGNPETYSEIIFNKKKKVLSVKLFENFNLENMEYSFNAKFKQSEEQLPEDGLVGVANQEEKFINFYLQPALGGLLLVFLFGLIFSYSLLLLGAKCYKFIFFGEPFNHQ
ncbi:MAG: hypothetical protein K9M15_02850 [Candidatus Marinimicrobia bacterium]|nr:hypothetical protein [Candidatus Neomarinimicrobiota bacterium]